ncbi:MAG TPA: adenosylmethionine--8-amino-7-oxononanoate transaminase [Gemmatimonadaceae bacterium]|nr:adenosylmethionine--8-amino-7-oxononanoate transaminase [Gemmatimonadaceae bacterium]
MIDRDLLARDARHVWHPYSRATAPPPLPVVRASGAYLHTPDGRAVLDAISSWWVTLHGHGHPAIAAAVAAQAAALEQVIFAGCTHEPAVRLAERLTSLAPAGLDRVFYSDDGSTAVEVALKIALQYWRIAGQDRDIIIAMEHAYHGDTVGAMSVSARGVFTAPFGAMMFDVARIPEPSSGDSLAALDALLDRDGGRCAALILEPMLLGAGGMRMYDAATLARIAHRATDAGVLVIADEVLTGFGRTGPLFACEHADVTPDLLCLSKGLTGGFLPLGATLLTSRIASTFDGRSPFGTLYHGHSYTANPIACAAALASLDLLDEACAERRDTIADAHRRGLATIRADSRVRAPRAIGTVAAFDLAGEVGYLSDAAAGLAAFALDRGVLVRPLGNVVYVLPPYCITDGELAHIYGVIAEWLDSA